MNGKLLRTYIKRILESSQEDRASIAGPSEKSIKWNYPTDPSSIIPGSMFFQHKGNPNKTFKGNYEVVSAPYFGKNSPKYSEEAKYDLIDLKGNVIEKNVTQKSSEYNWNVMRSRDDDERIEARTSRRTMKENWNNLADHAFWNSEKITKVHALNYAKQGTGTLQKYFTEYNSPSKRNKDELSCLGFYEKPIEWITNYVTRKSPLMFTCKGFVTWAAATDSYTNELNLLKPYQRQHWKQSGIPKLPAGKRNVGGRQYIDPKMVPFDPDDILLDEEDVKDFVTKPYISELIVDNWFLDTVYIASSHPELRDVKAFCSQMNIPLEIV